MHSHFWIRTVELLLALASSCVVAWQFSLILSAYADSWAPMKVALEVLRSPHANSLYETIFFSMGIKFQYPPSALIYLDVLTILNLNTTRRLNAINWVLLIVNAALVSALAVRLFSKGKLERYRRPLYWGSFLCALIYGPISIAFHIGQIQIIIDLLFTLTCLTLLGDRGRLAGACMGAATMVKPQFIIMLVQALLQRRWRFVLGFCATAGIVGLLSIELYGWFNHIEYFRVLRYLAERGETYAWNNSVNGILNRFLGNGSSTEVVRVSGVFQSMLPPYHPVVYWTTMGTSMVLALLPLGLPFVLLRSARDHRGTLLLFVIGALCSVIASPIAWIHHYGILPPIYLISLHLMLDQNHGKSRNLGLVLLLISFILTAARYPFFQSATGLLTLVHAPTFFGSLVLLAILICQAFGRERALCAATRIQYASR